MIIGYIVTAFTFFPLCVWYRLKTSRDVFDKPDYELVCFLCLMLSAFWPAYLFFMLLERIVKKIDEVMQDDQ